LSFNKKLQQVSALDSKMKLPCLNSYNTWDFEQAITTNLVRWTPKVHVYETHDKRYTPMKCTPMRYMPVRYVHIPLGGKCDPSPPPPKL
jgi:hypothetical protein